MAEYIPGQYDEQNAYVSAGIDRGLTPMEAYNEYQASKSSDSATQNSSNQEISTSENSTSEQKISKKTQEQIDKEAKDAEMKSAYDDEKQSYNDTYEYFKAQEERRAKEFENLTADIARIDAENDPMIQNIKDIFNRRITEMETTNKAMQGQVALSGVRTGLARYASQMQKGLVSAETTAGMNRISELESQKLNAIQMAKEALKSQAKDRWKTFNEYMNSATEAYNNKVQAVKDLHTFLKDEEDRAQAQQLAEIKIQSVIREEGQATAESIAGAVYSALGDDLEANMQFIIDTAKENNIDPNVLINTVMQYEQDDRDNQLELSKTLLDLGAKIPEGETQEVAPGVFVTGTKKPEELFVESIVGNTKYKDLYVKEDGEYVKKQRFDMGPAWKPSSSSGEKMSDEFKKWYYDTFEKIPWETDQDVIDEWERWQAVGGVEKEEETKVARQVITDDEIILLDEFGNEIKRISKTDSSSGEEGTEFDDMLN